MEIPFFPTTLAKLGLHVLTIEEAAALKVNELNLAKIGEFNLVKIENRFFGVMNAAPDELSELTARHAVEATKGVRNEQAEESPPALDGPPFRIAQHLLIDEGCSQRDSYSVSITPTIYFSTHRFANEQGCEISFRTWDRPMDRQLTLRFSQGRPKEITSYTNSAHFVRFTRRQAKVSDNTSFEYSAVRPGDSIFLAGTSPVGLTLDKSTKAALWHLIRRHPRSDDVHYLLLIHSS